MKRNAYSLLSNAFQGLKISPATPLRPLLIAQRVPVSGAVKPIIANYRPFSSTAPRNGSWLEPMLSRKKKMMKGRPRVPTGGSTKGTTVVWGDYGLRMTDHHRRISAQQFQLAQTTIKTRLRGMRYRLYTRVACNVGVFISGNEMRMGKGKGSFDHWAARVAINQVAFELRGAIHEAIVRDAFRLAGQKLPGQWEFVKKGDPAVVGITKLDGITLEDLKRPRRKVPELESPPISKAAADTTSSIPPST